MPLIDVARGTDEREWARSDRLRKLPAFEWPDAGRIVVIAPHPDDETLGVGGAMCLAKRLGFDIVLIGLTEGEASHAASTAISPARLASIRALERLTALSALGLAGSKLYQLGLPDGAVGQSVTLPQRLSVLLRGARCCFAPLRCDGHPDHEAAGRAAAQACASCGVQLCEYPVWAWSWARPNDDRVPWSRARRVALPDYARSAKQAAVRAYRSQTEAWSDAPAEQAVLTEAVLAYFARDFEVLFV